MVDWFVSDGLDKRDMRDPEKLGKRMSDDFDSVKHEFDVTSMSRFYDAHIARFANSYFPLVQEADGVYVGPLDRYGDPRA